MSDGARIDVFRRSSKSINNEQVSATYELAEGRKLSMQQDMRNAVGVYGDDPEHARFDVVSLIDDFSGSGKSLIREEDGKPAGKIVRFSKLIEEDAASTDPTFSGADTKIHVCLYVATEQAISHIRSMLTGWGTQFFRTAPQIHCLQLIDATVMVGPESEPRFDRLLHKYYSQALMDVHTEKGGSSIIYGFGGCALPVVFSHNTPNNSVYLLWAEMEEAVVHCFQDWSVTGNGCAKEPISSTRLGKCYER